MKNLAERMILEMDELETDIFTDRDRMLTKKSKAITSMIWHQLIYELDGLEPGEKRTAFDAEYRKRICQLPNEDLLLIVETYEKDLFKRAFDTIEAVRQELTERGLLKD